MGPGGTGGPPNIAPGGNGAFGVTEGRALTGSMVFESGAPLRTE